MTHEPAASTHAGLVGQELLPNLLHFGRLLRRLGFDAGPERLALLVEALSTVEISDRRQARFAARAVLVGRFAELELFDRAWEEFMSLAARGPRSVFSLGQTVARGSHKKPRLVARTDDPAQGPAELETDQLEIEVHQAASEVELLRRKDFAQLTADETVKVRRAIRQLAFPFAERRSRRFRPARTGERTDLRASLKAGLGTGGEVVRLLARQRRVKPRPLVVLADVSGSMEPYARMILELLYALHRGASLRGTGRQGAERREMFVFGTRLTHLTRSLADGSADRALNRAAAAVQDWGGGTRIGETLARFNRDWARRVLGQGAVVLLITDGWDCGEPEILRREVARLARAAHRLLWLNPLLGIAGYQPITLGAEGLLPWVDQHLPVHNLASVEDLARRLADLGRESQRVDHRRQHHA